MPLSINYLRFKKIIVFVFFFLQSSFYSQEQKPLNISFFDKNGDLSSIEDAYYFRQTTDTLNFYRSYYAKDSSLFFRGQIISAKDSSDKKNIYTGTCTWYYPNGNKKTENNYSVNGILNGLCTEYFENGLTKRKAEYELGKIKGKSYLIFGKNGSCAEVFEDDFIDNRYNWALMNNDTGSTKIKIGGLELASKKRNGFLKLFSRPVQTKNYSLETTMSSGYLNDTIKTGLIFGYKDPNNYYYFTISNHKCSIGYFKDGKDLKQVINFTVLILKTNSTNSIKVISLKNKLFYYVNDEAIFSSEKNDSLGAIMGLCIQTSGIVLFDKLNIKEYKNDLVIESLQPKTKNRSIYELSNIDYGIQNFSTGVLLNTEGLILTNSYNFKTYNQICVQITIHDSLKTFFAEVLFKNESVNIALLKITNLQGAQLPPPAYCFFSKDKLDLGTDLQCYYYTKYHTKNDKPRILEGSLKSKARFENLSNFFSTSIFTEDIALGSPIFTKEGELLGIVTETDLKSHATKINAVDNVIFLSLIKFEKLKKPKIVDAEKIMKNCVLIQVK